MLLLTCPYGYGWQIIINNIFYFKYHRSQIIQCITKYTTVSHRHKERHKYMHMIMQSECSLLSVLFKSGSCVQRQEVDVQEEHWVQQEGALLLKFLNTQQRPCAVGCPKHSKKLKKKGSQSDKYTATKNTTTKITHKNRTPRGHIARLSNIS